MQAPISSKFSTFHFISLSVFGGHGPQSTAPQYIIGSDMPSTLGLVIYFCYSNQHCLFSNCCPKLSNHRRTEPYHQCTPHCPRPYVQKQPGLRAQALQQHWKFCDRAHVAAFGCNLRLLVISLECLGCVCQGAARD